MRRTRARLAVCLVLLPATMLRSAEEPSLPDGVNDAYRGLEESMRTEDIAGFMTVFDLDFIYESLDSSTRDRGPWRRLWMKRFEEGRYETVTFEPQRITARDEERVVVRSRRVWVIEEAATALRRLEEALVEDTWGQSDGDWKLLYRAEKEVRTRGTVETSPRTQIDSPRIAKLARELAAGDAKCLDAFREELEKTGSPLLEPVPPSASDNESPSGCFATFCWRGAGRESRVRLEGGLPAREGPKPLVRLGESDLWYRTERLPCDARFTYSFHIEEKVSVPRVGSQPEATFLVSSVRSDPLNRKVVDDLSAVEMPAAKPLTWITPVEGRPSGELERKTIRSKVLGERRFVSVYTPAGYEEDGTPYRPVLLLDRWDYASRRSAGVALDNLIAEKKLPPLVLFMVHSEGSRRKEFELSPEFVRFLAEELAAWAKENYSISESPDARTIGGNGIGAALAALCASEHPGVFGNVLAESGDFSPTPSSSGEDVAGVARRLSTIPKQALRFYVTVGSFEERAVVDSNRHLRDVLVAKGYPVTYISFPGNNHSTTRLASLAEGIGTLLSR